MFKDIYRGMVVDADDPLKRGRVKVFVPNVNVALLKDWNKKLDENKFFVSLGDACGQGMTKDIHQRLRIALPWAEVMMPIIGTSAGARWEPKNNTSTIALVTQDQTCDGEEGGGMAGINEKTEAAVAGPEDEEDRTGVQKPEEFKNTDASDLGALESTNMSNAAQKTISVPRENAHVYVMFENGDPQYPIVVGTITRAEDHAGMHNRPIE